MKINDNDGLKKTERVLQHTGTLNLGGAETMIMNVFRAIDRHRIQFDFVVSGSEIGYYEEEAELLGANIFHIAKRSESFGKHLCALYRVIKSKKYRIVHFHTQNAFLTSIDIIVCRIAGAKKIIVHSHNSMDWRSNKLILLSKLFRPILRLLTTEKFSCGEEAAKWLFGTTKNVKIVPLPVVCNKYLYSKSKYNEFRKKYNISSQTKVFSHTGRFSDVKNHKFLIDVFEKIVNKSPDSILFLLGDGELKNSIIDKVKSKNLDDKVVFCGNISNVNEILIMSDVFLLPSKYEGFPTVVLEAQAAGLPCLISDTITEKIKITDLVRFLPIDSGTIPWEDAVLDVIDSNGTSREEANKLIAEKYDSSIVTKIFEDNYANLKGKKD